MKLANDPKFHGSVPPFFDYKLSFPTVSTDSDYLETHYAATASEKNQPLRNFYNAAETTRMPRNRNRTDLPNANLYDEDELVSLKSTEQGLLLYREHEDDWAFWFQRMGTDLFSPVPGSGAGVLPRAPTLAEKLAADHFSIMGGAQEAQVGHDHGHELRGDRLRTKYRSLEGSYGGSYRTAGQGACDNFQPGSKHNMTGVVATERHFRGEHVMLREVLDFLHDPMYELWHGGVSNLSPMVKKWGQKFTSTATTATSSTSTSSTEWLSKLSRLRIKARR